MATKACYVTYKDTNSGATHNAQTMITGVTGEATADDCRKVWAQNHRQFEILDFGLIGDVSDAESARVLGSISGAQGAARTAPPMPKVTPVA